MHPNIYSEVVNPQVWLIHHLLIFVITLWVAKKILPIFLIIDSLASIYGHYSIVSLSHNTLILFLFNVGLAASPFSVCLDSNLTMCFCNYNQTMPAFLCCLQFYSTKLCDSCTLHYYTMVCIKGKRINLLLCTD